MKIFKPDEYVQRENPTPDDNLRMEILTAADNAKKLAGIFIVLPPGNQMPYHYHKKRESLIFIISGKGLEKVENEDFAVRAGDVIYIPANEKHMLINNTSEDLRYLEYYSPIKKDYIEVE